jgi:transcriptional regulator with XRE-family HTH domain
VSTVPSSSVRQAREALGARLRALRHDAGLTARELAETTAQHYSRVSKIENGVQFPTDDDIRAWCRACDADAEVPDLIATLRAVDSAYKEFRRESRAGMKRVVGAHTSELYGRTTVFRIYEHNVIPGLFQTPAYCSAMLSFWTKFLEAPDDIDEAVAARMQRQQILYRRGTTFVVLLEEQALRTWFDTAETQLGQLDRLLSLMTLPSVSLGIIPLMVERPAVGSAGFWIFDDGLVALETPTASIAVTRPGEVALYRRMFDVLKAPARTGPDAAALIRGIVGELTER